MGYVETLFGHQHPILSISSLKGDYCVSVGGRDRTARYWKVVEETQLVFRGGGGGGGKRLREVLEGNFGVDAEIDEDERPDKDKKSAGSSCVEGSLESVVMIDETTFITGGDSGYVLLQPSHLFPSPLPSHPHLTYTFSLQFDFSLGNIQKKAYIYLPSSTWSDS
jgi:ribosomal RNA-processing protein 9